jgi:hypothetical protein
MVALSLIAGSPAWAQPASETDGPDGMGWHRPGDQPVFTTEHGNNHDVILFVEPELEYPYHLIVSHEASGADLWRAKRFSWNSDDWELVDGQYKIARHYEFDDGVKVDGTYYIFEQGNVYTYSGPLEEASGKWKKAGSFPAGRCADLGVYYEDGTFHIFGEYGHFPHGPDGTSLSHFTSQTGLGDWQLVDTKAADANPDGGDTYGVGDPTIAKIDGTYYLYSDRETKNRSYNIVAWKSDDLNEPFELLGPVITPRRDAKDDWDNQRIQDGEIAYSPDLGRYIMLCNMRDTDGNPGGDFPNLNGSTRVVGTFYSKPVPEDEAGN